MNDRYLFKAKRKNWKKLPKEEWWVQGNIIYDGVTGQHFIHAYGNSVNESDKVNEEGCLSFVAFEIDESSLCQCTGLKDKNGTMIWENDILRYKYGGKIKVDVIKYDAPMFTYSRAIRWDLYSDEVIGNIFDNPELLEVE